MTKGTGSFALILHAHLPFVRHPEHEFFREENWLFEAVSESYVPLLQMIRRLLRRGVRFKLTLSVSPTLCAMLADPLLRDRYIRHLDLLIALAERECERNRAEKNLLSLSEFYREFFADTRRTFVEEWDCDLLGVFRQLRGRQIHGDPPIRIFEGGVLDRHAHSVAGFPYGRFRQADNIGSG